MSGYDRRGRRRRVREPPSTSCRPSRAKRMVISRSASPAQEEESILWLGNRASAIERYFTPARRPSTTRSICGIRLRRCSVMRLSAGAGRDRKSVVEGKGVSVRVDSGGRRVIKKKKKRK